MNKNSLLWWPKKIISGGQTGADIGGLIAAKQLGIETGGYAPKNFKTEKGTNLALRDVYGLVETDSHQYSTRTKLNVQNSDLTLIFSFKKSAGSIFTRKTCLTEDKYYFEFVLSDKLLTEIAEEFRNILKLDPVNVINIAGNRESVYPGIREIVIKFLLRVFEQYD